MELMGKSLESLKHEEKTRECPDCGSTQIGFDKGEDFCRKCGLVLD
jgi:ribosomal protein S27E